MSDIDIKKEEKTEDKIEEKTGAAKKLVRWPYLVAGVIMMLLAGIIYAWSILKVPLAAEFGWDSAGLGLNFTITMCGFVIGGILGGILTKKLSPRVTVILFSIVIFIGFFGSSRLTGAIGLLYVFYGGLAGVGIGVTYNVVISAVTKWFPDKRATASGALMMGFGASSLVFGPIMNGLIHTSGWRNAYFFLGLIIMVVLIIGAFFLRVPDARVNVLGAGGRKKVSEAHGARETSEDQTTGQMVRQSSFWKSYLILMLISAVGNGVISLAMDVSLSVGVTQALAVSLVGVLSVCNGLSRILFGFLYDTIGRKRTMLIAGAIAILASAIMLVSVWLGVWPLLIAGFVLVGLAYGSCPPIASGVAGSFFGTKNFALNFSVYNTQLFPASFAATIAGVILRSTGSYVPFFIMLVVFTLIALVLNLSLKKV
ncbi:MFS transporter [Clostridia bacterium]|nr:MFS transporter [Clostridia bacterium]